VTIGHEVRDRSSMGEDVLIAVLDGTVAVGHEADGNDPRARGGRCRCDDLPTGRPHRRLEARRRAHEGKLRQP
jgi:hypothetical protein